MSESISTIVGDAANDFAWSSYDTVMELVDFLDGLVRKGVISADDLYQFIFVENIKPKKRKKVKKK